MAAPKFGGPIGRIARIIRKAGSEQREMEGAGMSFLGLRPSAIKMDKTRQGKFNGRRLYTGLRLDYRLRLWAPTSALRDVSAVAEVSEVLIRVFMRPIALL